jgi:hypothetical protein
MKWTGIYLVGYFIVICGIFAALWKLDILANAGTMWTVIGIVIAIGVGIMLAVNSKGGKDRQE